MVVFKLSTLKSSCSLEIYQYKFGWSFWRFLLAKSTSSFNFSGAIKRSSFSLCFFTETQEARKKKSRRGAIFFNWNNFDKNSGFQPNFIDFKTKNAVIIYNVKWIWKNFLATNAQFFFLILFRKSVLRHLIFFWTLLSVNAFANLLWSVWNA